MYDDYVAEQKRISNTVFTILEHAAKLSDGEAIEARLDDMNTVRVSLDEGWFVTWITDDYRETVYDGTSFMHIKHKLFEYIEAVMETAGMDLSTNWQNITISEEG